MGKTISAEALEEIAERVEGTATASYSGRGMYGESCIGITTDNTSLLGAAIVVVLGEEQGWALAKATRTDSMGLSTIAYWPNWKLNEGDKLSADHDEDEEEEE